MSERTALQKYGPWYASVAASAVFLAGFAMAGVQCALAEQPVNRFFIIGCLLMGMSFFLMLVVLATLVANGLHRE